MPCLRSYQTQQDLTVSSLLLMAAIYVVAQVTTSATARRALLGPIVDELGTLAKKK